eukprot:7477073-Pyramimonas_sp.AAC.1
MTLPRTVRPRRSCGRWLGRRSSTAAGAVFASTSAASRSSTRARSAGRSARSSGNTGTAVPTTGSARGTC